MWINSSWINAKPKNSKHLTSISEYSHTAVFYFFLTESHSKFMYSMSFLNINNLLMFFRIPRVQYWNFHLDATLLLLACSTVGYAVFALRTSLSLERHSVFGVAFFLCLPSCSSGRVLMHWQSWCVPERWIRFAIFALPSTPPWLQLT